MHGITEKDNMFYVGDEPWHRLGNRLNEIATAEEAILASNLDWKVCKVPIFTKEGMEIPGKYGVERQDTKDILGVVGRYYRPLQNREAFKFFDNVVNDPNGPKYVTAGSLYGGRKIWILAKLPSYIEVIRNDVVEEYILLSNSHDGTRPINIQWTPVRVVCNNTLNLALSRNSGVKFRHMSISNVHVLKTRDILGISVENHQNMVEVIQRLVRYEPTKDEINAVLSSLFNSSGKKRQTRSENIKNEVKRLMVEGKGNDIRGVRGTAWALYNGITEYADHYKAIKAKGNKDESRLDSIWFGSAAELKSKALSKILTMMR